MVVAGTTTTTTRRTTTVPGPADRWVVLPKRLPGSTGAASIVMWLWLLLLLVVLVVWKKHRVGSLPSFGLLAFEDACEHTDNDDDDDNEDDEI